MKLFNNLPGLLRVIFFTLRFVTILLALVWALILTFGAVIRTKFAHDSKLMVTAGKVSLLPGSAAAVGLHSDTAGPGALSASGLQADLQLDLSSPDEGLVKALRWAVIPAMAVLVVFAWRLFGNLREVCANIERGEVFTEKNLRLVRGTGLTLLGYGVATVLVNMWASYVMNGYLLQHVSVTGLAGASGLGSVRFQMLPELLLSAGASLVIGALVLVVAEAFRQGLNLKSENDLTV